MNSATVKQAPAEAMIQLGYCVQQIIATLVYNYYEKTPFRFTKIGTKDGFWRMAASDTDAWNFYYVLQQFNKVENIEEIEVVVPKLLQMGWCESPPFFCILSKTARHGIDTVLN